MLPGEDLHGFAEMYGLDFSAYKGTEPEGDAYRPSTPMVGTTVYAADADSDRKAMSMWSLRYGTDITSLIGSATCRQELVGRGCETSPPPPRRAGSHRRRAMDGCELNPAEHPGTLAAGTDGLDRRCEQSSAEAPSAGRAANVTRNPPDIGKRPKEPRVRIVRPIRESVESFGSPWPLRAGITLRGAPAPANRLIHEVYRIAKPSRQIVHTSAQTPVGPAAAAVRK